MNGNYIVFPMFGPKTLQTDKIGEIKQVMFSNLYAHNNN